MRLHIDNGEVTVVLSKRNLRALLQKVELPDSAKKLDSNVIFIDGELQSGEREWTVKCEDDETHYFGPLRPPETQGIAGLTLLDITERTKLDA
jgi:hypothetical protein